MDNILFYAIINVFSRKIVPGYRLCICKMQNINTLWRIVQFITHYHIYSDYIQVNIHFCVGPGH